jgi:predicted enzyme related to lactoylglutathione lyase
MGLPEAPAMWMTYLAMSDADAAAAKIKGAGGQLVTEPVDVMDAGRVAVAVDPAGAVFGVWQARAFPGAQIVNEPGAMCWNEQLSRDFEGSKAFYAAVFG